jgi:uncharacterized membrane protein YgaE (UPF0421/DUF939 family)
MLITADLRDIEEHLSGWLVRLRLRDALVWSVRGLVAGLAVGLGLSLVARLRPVLPVPALVGLSLSAALVGFALALALAYFWPRSRLAAARAFDRLFGLAERTSTALELAASRDSIPDWLIRDQWADAAAMARKVNPASRLPLAVDRRDLLLLVGVSAALALSLYLPNPQQTILAQQRAVRQAIAEQIAQIEALRTQIENDPTLTEEQKEELTRPLDEAQERLESGDLTREQAVQILTQAQQELQQLADPNAQAQAEALRQAGESLSQNATTQSVGEALASGDLQGAAEALANIDPARLSEAERQALADQLEQTAQALQGTNPELAEQMQAAAEALRRGDTTAARAALQQAAQSVAQTGQAAAQAQAASQAAAQVSQAQRAVAQAGSQQGQGQGQGQGGQGQNQGQGQGQGQGEGQGSGSTQGQNQGQGSGAGRGEGTGQGQGGEVGTDPIGQDNAPGDGGESVYEPIYSPYLLGGSGEGEQVDLPGSGDPGDEVVGEGPTNPQEAGSVTVPYNEVYRAYAEAVRSAIASGEVPLSLRDVVRQYFSSLEP